MIAYDSETYLIQPGLLAPKMVCGSFCQDAFEEGSRKAIVLLRDAALPRLEFDLRSGEMIAGAHIAYDLAVAIVACPAIAPLVWEAYDRGQIYDVLLGDQLIQIWETGQAGHPSLASCVQRWLNIDISRSKGPDTWRTRYSDLDGVPVDQWPQEAYEYARDDAVYTLQVAQAQQEYVEENKISNLEAMPEQARAAWALHLSSCWGLRTDPVATDRLAATIEADYAATIAKCQTRGLVREDGTKDVAEIRRRIDLALGDAAPKTKGGQTQTSAEALEIAGPDLAWLCDLADLTKIKGTYLPVVRAGTEIPITPRPNALVSTGRTSYTGIPFQCLPKTGGVRECFVPRRGHLLCSCDYSTLELCTLSQVCLWVAGYSRMAEAICAGRDLHAQFGGALSGWSYDETIARLRAKDPQAKNFRTLSKPANFGFPGGLGPAKMVLYAWRGYGVHLCVTAGEAETCGATLVSREDGSKICATCLSFAKRLRADWFRSWPEVEQYHAAIKRHTAGFDGGRLQITGPDHLPRGISRGRCHFTDGANLGFQGLAARGAKEAIYRVCREAYTARGSDPLRGTRPLLFLHDEILAEIPEDRAHEAAHRIAAIMVETMLEYVPDVPSKVEPAIMRRWHKAAESVYVDGRLVPWEPEVKK